MEISVYSGGTRNVSLLRKFEVWRKLEAFVIKDVEFVEGEGHG